jgi:predicted dehydrogenase
MKRRTFLSASSAALIASQQISYSQEPTYRVGILGSDNSHSGAFSKLINVDKKIPGVEVVAMYGHDDARNKEMAAMGNVKTIVERPEQMLDLINVAIVDTRHGDLHMDLAMPFIEKGMPIFVDKPFALKTADAYEMLYAAQTSGSYLSSFSTVRWGDEVKECLEKLPSLEPVITGSASGPGSA